ncbi:ribokinase [Corynebacterium pyruviciproducens]|uniref:ribokinase n=1 Tax=Corynebacterium pyruviciproducens TaxID=598660 RepID=UPI00254AF7F0|nr:ribokinase [Corynebacterium pyruviciproducens]MDK7215143.1 ribokinase [Corynebacterium pyruviciproducens]
MSAVYVVGSANFDRFLYVDRFVVAGETISSTQLEEACGGKGLNQAVAAARAGAPTWMVGNLGGDGAGDTIRAAIAQEENLHQDYLFTDAERPTGQTMIQINAEGDNAIVLIAGSHATITADYIDKTLQNVAAGDVVVCQREIPDEMTKHALKQAKAKGAFTILNLAPATADRSLLPDVDLLIVNETEAATLLGLEQTPADPQDLPARILDQTGTDTILTYGDKGAFVATSTEQFHVPAIKCDVVDTTGAGDAFVGATAALIAEKKDLTTATLFGIAAATAACGSKGAQSYPQRRPDFQKIAK